MAQFIRAMIHCIQHNIGVVLGDPDIMLTLKLILTSRAVCLYCTERLLNLVF